MIVKVILAVLAIVALSEQISYNECQTIVPECNENKTIAYNKFLSNWDKHTKSYKFDCDYENQLKELITSHNTAVEAGPERCKNNFILYSYAIQKYKYSSSMCISPAGERAKLLPFMYQNIAMTPDIIEQLENFCDEFVPFNNEACKLMAGEKVCDVPAAFFEQYTSKWVHCVEQVQANE